MLYLTDRTKLTNVIDPLLRHDGLETSLPGLFETNPREFVGFEI